MQLNTARRSNKTYGKGNKTSRVHDLFNYRSSHDDSSATVSSAASPAPPSDAQPFPVARELDQGPKSLSPEPLSHPTRPTITDKTKPTRSLLQDTSMYEMPSSEDERASDTSGSKASKRRRVVGTGSDLRSSAQAKAQPVSKRTYDSGEGQREAKQTRNSQRNAHSTKRVWKAPTVPQKSDGVARTQPAALQAKSAEPALVTKPAPVHRNKRSGSPIVVSRRSEDAQLADYSGTDASEHQSERSHHSATKSKIAIKRKRLSPGATDSDLSSPSNIGLTGLKLSTPRLSPAGMSPEPSSDASTKQKRIRRRLIDRLDAPANNARATSEEQLSDIGATSTPGNTKKSSKLRSKLAHGERKDNQSRDANVHTEGVHDSQTRPNWTTKPRMTYATQRSHLSDMVNDLDTLDEPSSQKSTDEFLLQISASNTASQLELDDDSDDSAGGGKLKSIHELRQAGVNNRFERELDALLEDIDAGKTASKALRLQALVKLAGKLQDSGFARHIATGGRIARLTTISNQQVDLPTSILLLSTYSLLAMTETISLGMLGQLFKAATDLAPSMLVDERSLAEVARDRKQNLSKALVRDLLEFVEGHGTSDKPPSIADKFCSDWTALSCLECILRRLIGLGHTSARLSTSVYATILRSLSSQVQRLGGDGDKSSHLSRMETTLSLLELCSFCVDDADLHIADHEYETLGNALAEIIHQSPSLPKSLEGGVLRVVVSLSNNRPRMCQLLGNTTISKATFGIIDENFLNLARQAENGEALNEQKLDSVVLALGCLLNFAECDPTLRTRLSNRNPGEEDYIAQLVTIFNFQVSKVDEAMTTEQSQVSVAFGYLAMLLCTLSLHPAIKAQVTQLLRNKSFGELCSAAEKFFSHLRTLEYISEDDATMSAFTARFSAILETVRTL